MVKNVIQVQSGAIINIDVSAKRHHICEKQHISNPDTCSFKHCIYLVIIFDNSVITCDEIIDAEAKLHDEEGNTVTGNFNEKNSICKAKKFYMLLAFLLINITLLIPVSICCYLIK